jgi:serine/threonine protein kinase
MVANAMSLIHTQRYVHLDVKPSNLMVRAFSTGDEQHPYPFLPQVIDLSMADKLSSMLCSDSSTTGMPGWQLMDSLPLNPAGEMAVGCQQDKVGLSSWVCCYWPLLHATAKGPQQHTCCCSSSLKRVRTKCCRRCLHTAC